MNYKYMKAKYILNLLTQFTTLVDIFTCLVLLLTLHFKNIFLFIMNITKKFYILLNSSQLIFLNRSLQWTLSKIFSYEIVRYVLHLFSSLFSLINMILINGGVFKNLMMNILIKFQYCRYFISFQVVLI